MICCRYVGGDSSEIGEREYTSVGEMAMFSEALFKDVVLGGAAFIPEVVFKKIGFTQEEISKFGSYETRDDAPSVFYEKLQRCQDAFLDIRKQLSSRSMKEVIAEFSEAPGFQTE